MICRLSDVSAERYDTTGLSGRTYRLRMTFSYWSTSEIWPTSRALWSAPVATHSTSME